MFWKRSALIKHKNIFASLKQVLFLIWRYSVLSCFCEIVYSDLAIRLSCFFYSTHAQNHGLPTERQPFEESTVLLKMNCLKTDLSVSKLSCLFLSTAKCDYCMVEAQSLTMK